MPVQVIAEPGGTGQGDYATMVRLLETAKTCGADIWKPQFTVDAERHLAQRSKNLSTDERAAFLATYRRAYHWLQWPAYWHADFRDRCHLLGMQYACSVCLPEDVAAVAPFVDYLKIASFDANNGALLDAARATTVPVIRSAGMGSTEHAPGTLTLHCVAAYPAPMNAMNLRVLRDHQYYGLSDHSKALLTGGLAAALGARMIEAHYRLDDCDPAHPDFAVSFAPDAFATYVEIIRVSEILLGDGVKKLEPCEWETSRYRVLG